MRNSAKSMDTTPSVYPAGAPQQEMAGLMDRHRGGTNGADDRRSPAEPDAGRRDLEDRLMRALAEQQSIREHSRRQMQRAVEFAGSRLAADLLDTADNLQRAIASVPDDALADSSLAAIVRRRGGDRARAFVGLHQAWHRL